MPANLTYPNRAIESCTDTCQRSARLFSPSAPCSVIAEYQNQVRYMPVTMRNTAATRSRYRIAERKTRSSPPLANASVTVKPVTVRPIPTPYSVVLTTPLAKPLVANVPKMTLMNSGIVQPSEATA